jgi:hypothetical protein
MPRVGFEPATPATKRPQTYALYRAATGIGDNLFSMDLNNVGKKHRNSVTGH